MEVKGLVIEFQTVKAYRSKISHKHTSIFYNLTEISLSLTPPEKISRKTRFNYVLIKFSAHNLNYEYPFEF